MESHHFVAFGIRQPQPAPSGLFIHDFTRIDLSFGAVVGAFTHFVEPKLLGRLVLEAWRAELAEVGREIRHRPAATDTSGVEVIVGQMRTRDDSVIIPILWRSATNEWVPPLQADLEVASFGPNRSHLHLLGLSALPDGVAACSHRASLEHRLTVAVTRHFLASLASVLEGRGLESTNNL